MARSRNHTGHAAMSDGHEQEPPFDSVSRQGIVAAMSAPDASANPLPPPSASGPNARRWSLTDVALLAAVLIFALVLRITNYDTALSMDELWHLATTPGLGNALGQFPSDVLLSGLPSQTSLENAAPVWRVWLGMDGVLHPPLYILSLRLWREIFGQSDFIAQLHSTFWSMVALGFLFAIGRLAMDRWMGLLVCLGTAVSQAQMYFAQEVRSYQMLIAIATIALWMMTRIEVFGASRMRAIGLAAITFPLLLTHYFAFGAAVAIGVYGLLRLRGHRVAFVVTCAVAGAIYLVSWVPFALKQVDDLYTGDAFLHEPQFNWLTELARVMCAPWRVLNDVDYADDRTTLLAGSLLVLPWLLIRQNRSLLPWVMWLTFTLLAVAMLDVVRSTKHLIFPRYFAAISPAVLLLVLGSAWAIDRKAAYVVGLAMAVLVAIGGRVEHRISVDSPTYASAVAYVRERIKPDEALLVSKGLADKVYNDMVALTFSHSPEFQQRPTVLMTQPLSPDVLERLPRRAWLVVGGLDLSRLETSAGFQIIEKKLVPDEAFLFHVELSRGAEKGSPPASRPAAGVVP